MKQAYRTMVIVALAAVALASCGGDSTEAANAEEAAAAAITLGADDVTHAVRATVTSGVPLSGPLSPKVKVDVGAPLAEQITAMLVDEGTRVTAGQPVARFRDDVLRAAAASARAEVATTRMAVAVAVADSTRAEALFREGAISRRDHDNAMLATESARARFALAEAQAASAEDRLETATLKAPVSGVISARHAQAGDRVDFGKPVVSIVDTRVLELEASVEAQWLRELRVGRAVQLTMSQLPGDTITGRIARINPTADPATRQVRVYVDVPNGSGRLVGGLFVSGQAIVSEARNVVTVPVNAVRVEGAEAATFVYVVASDVVSRRPVTTGLRDAGRGVVEIRSGVAAGEAVVVGSVEELSDGSRVQIAARPAAPARN